jgi:hypothetical protein
MGWCCGFCSLFDYLCLSPNPVWTREMKLMMSNFWALGGTHCSNPLLRLFPKGRSSFPLSLITKRLLFFPDLNMNFF